MASRQTPPFNWHTVWNPGYGIHTATVVDPIAGHGRHLAGPPEGLDDLQFIGRADPAKHLHPLDHPAEHFRLQLVQPQGAEDLYRPPAGQVQFS